VIQREPKVKNRSKFAVITPVFDTVFNNFISLKAKLAQYKIVVINNIINTMFIVKF
jgi:hypothetical protein